MDHDQELRSCADPQIIITNLAGLFLLLAYATTSGQSVYNLINGMPASPCELSLMKALKQATPLDSVTFFCLRGASWGPCLKAQYTVKGGASKLPPSLVVNICYEALVLQSYLQVVHILTAISLSEHLGHSKLFAPPNL